MDSQERHELKQNDLYEFLTHFKQWWDKNGTSTLLIIVCALGGVMGYRWYSSRETRLNEQAWGAMAVAQQPDELVRVAEDYPDTPVARMAMLQAGDTLLQQATFGVPDPANEAMPRQLTAEETQDYLDRASKLYEKVIATGHGEGLPSLVVLNARLGLAATYESMGQFDKAVEQYTAVQKEAGPYKMLASKASAQGKQIEALRQTVIFPEAPPVDTTPTELSPDKPLPPGVIVEPGGEVEFAPEFKNPLEIDLPKEDDANAQPDEDDRTDIPLNNPLDPTAP